jgi:tryptophan-rich sensory protein
MWQKIKPYLISVAIALAVGGLSAFLTRNSMNIYEELQTPPLSPPSILFPIVWTLLYILMGIGAALVYTKREQNGEAARSALTVYAVNLVVNFFWSIIFFNMRAFLAAFIWLLLLFYIIIRMILDFRHLSPLAAYLQIPYAIWVAFAGYLNFGIWFLNR